MFHLGYDRKDLALRVTVSNAGGDDAYEAKLLANFPGVLSYSGFRSATAVRATDDTLVPPSGSSAMFTTFSLVGFKHRTVGSLTNLNWQVF